MGVLPGVFCFEIGQSDARASNATMVYFKTRDLSSKTGRSTGMRQVACEPPRELRRLHDLREWIHEQDKQIFNLEISVGELDPAGNAGKLWVWRSSGESPDG